MARRARRFEILETWDGRFYWHIKASNGEVVAMSAGGAQRMYKQLAACIKELRKLFGDSPSLHDALEEEITKAIQRKKINDKRLRELR